MSTMLRAPQYMSAEERDQVIAMTRRGMTQRQIFEATGHSIGRVKGIVRYARHVGLLPPPNDRGRPKLRGRDDEILAMQEDGKSADEIAAALDCHPMTIRRRLQALGPAPLGDRSYVIKEKVEAAAFAGIVFQDDPRAARPEPRRQLRRQVTGAHGLGASSLYGIGVEVA